MSRLIDEKEFINSRPENLNLNINDEIKSAYNKGWNACNSEWINLIQEQPTAYDIDKMIEQLRVLYEMVRIDQKLAVSQAIEIVKKGGAR